MTATARPTAAHGMAAAARMTAVAPTTAGRRADVVAPTPAPASTAVAAGVVVVAGISNPDVPALAIAGSDSDCAGHQAQRCEHACRCERRS
jgi:hypothetical protein